MDRNSHQKKTNEAEVKKQNQDLPNMPASTDKADSGETLNRQIEKTSKLQNDGKTDNTERNAEK